MALWEQALEVIEQAEDSTNRLVEMRVLIFEGLGRTQEADHLVAEWAAAGFLIRAHDR